MTTPVPYLNSPEGLAYLDTHEDRETRLRATAWLRGRNLLDQADARKSDVAHTVLFMAGLDPAWDAAWAVKQMTPEGLLTVGVAGWLADSALWRDLENEFRTDFETWFETYTTAKKAEQEAAQALADAQAAVRDAQKALQDAIESGDDEALVAARADLVAAREALAALQ